MAFPSGGQTMAFFSIGGLVALAFLLAFRLRHQIAPHLPHRLRHLVEGGYTLLPTRSDGTTFTSARSAGLNSRLFDIDANIASADQRALDAEEVQRIMQEMDVGFDEARLVRHKRYLARNGVDASGLPTDKKAVTSLS